MRKVVCDFLNSYVQNYPSIFDPAALGGQLVGGIDLQETGGIWESPLVGFSDPRNELFDYYKELISESHQTPLEVLPSAETVISYFLPFKKSIAKTNYVSKSEQASLEWSEAYIITNKLIVDINEAFYQEFESEYESSRLPPTHNFDKVALMSDFSHKHIAYVSGIGKFGMNQLFITNAGCAGRLGTIVTEMPVEEFDSIPDEEFCLYKTNGTCLICMDNCFSGALKKENIESGEYYDRHKCYETCTQNDSTYKEMVGDGAVADVCGKCAVSVPCSHKKPS